jgi:hypothetical protein
MTELSGAGENDAAHGENEFVIAGLTVKRVR